jgi:hypothetical protein
LKQATECVNLENNIEEIQELGEHVDCDDVAAKSAARTLTDQQTETAAAAFPASRNIFAAGSQETIKHISEELQSVFSPLQLLRTLKQSRRSEYVRGINSTFAVQLPPNQTGKPEEKSLRQQNPGDPLIISDHVTLIVLVFFGYVLIVG